MGGEAVEPRTPSGWNSAKYKMISESLQLLLRRSIVLLSASPTHGFYHQMWQTAPALTVCRWGCRIWWEPRCCKCRQEAWGWREAAAACSGQVWWNRGWKMRVGESYYPSFHKRGWDKCLCEPYYPSFHKRGWKTSVIPLSSSIWPPVTPSQKVRQCMLIFWKMLTTFIRWMRLPIQMRTLK